MRRKGEGGRGMGVENMRRRCGSMEEGGGRKYEEEGAEVGGGHGVYV
jgi:hypothetical protein